MQRIDKQNYYLDIAESVLERGTCLRRNYGAIIVKNDEIVATGYTGAPRGRKNCDDMGFCMREHLQIPSGQRYELCRSVHAEANAIFGGQRREDRCNDRLPGELLHVPAPDHQRRQRHCGDTKPAGGDPGGARTAVGRGR